MQLGLEQVERNRFKGRRNEATNMVSAYLGLATRSPRWDVIKQQSIQDLNRLLVSGTQDLRTISAEQAFQAVLATEEESIYIVARNLGRDHSDISRYRRVTGVVLVGILQREGLISELPSAIDQVKYEQIRKLHQKADTIDFIIGKPKIKQQLGQVPELKALLKSFIECSTVKSFLDENMVSYKPGDIAKINFNFRDYLFGNNPSTIGPLLRRATFSRWINGHTNWYGSIQTEIDETIDRSAEFVCSTKPPSEKKNEACRTRAFLGEVVAQEFRLAKQDIRFGHDYAFEDMFVPKNGIGIEDFDDIDIPKTFGLFADVTYCPQVLKSIVQEYLAGAKSHLSYAALAVNIYKHLAYATVYKAKWIEDGFKFLNNVLLLKPGESPSWESLLFDRRDAWRQFRGDFQKYLLGV